MKNLAAFAIIALLGCGSPEAGTTSSGASLPLAEPSADVAVSGGSGATPSASATEDEIVTPPAPWTDPRTSTSAPESFVAKSKEELEWLNDGCKYRKNSNKISKCEARTSSFGDWKPTKAEVGLALQLDGGLCYCAKPVERPVLTCMDSAKAALVSVTIGASDDLTDCTVVVSSAEFDGRRWIRVLADNRDRSTFYQTERIVQIEGGAAVRYYLGYEALTEAIVQSSEEGVSQKLREDWPKLSTAAKRWLGRP